MSRKKILITGMSGLIGQVVASRLKSTYELSALNRRFVEGITCHQADIADLEANLISHHIESIIHNPAAGPLMADIIGFGTLGNHV